MDSRKYGQVMQQQHQPLFKQIKSANGKYPTKSTTHHVSDMPSTYNQYKQQSEQLQQHILIAEQHPQKSQLQQRKEGGSVGPQAITPNNLKSYTKRGASTRMASQIINPAASQTHHESYDSSGGSKNIYKIDFQQKQLALTRKHSKVKTLVNSFVNSTGNTASIMHSSIGSKVASTKNKRGQNSMQKSLESPIKQPEAHKANDLITNGQKTSKQIRQGTGQNLAITKKRFYNSIGSSALVSENQTPKINSHSIAQYKTNEKQFSYEDQSLIQPQVVFNNRTSAIHVKKHPASGLGQHNESKSHSTTQGSNTLVNNTPSRRKNRQVKQQSQNTSSNQQVVVPQYSSQISYNKGAQNMRNTISSVGKRRRTSKQMSTANSQSNLQTSIIQSSGDYQLTSLSQVSPTKQTTKLYKHQMNHTAGSKSYIPINSGTFSIAPNGSGPSTNNGFSGEDTVAHNIGEITPHQQPNSSIFNQYVKQGHSAKMQAVASEMSQQQEYNQQAVPVSSYYLLHGKMSNNKRSKQKSYSVKTNDMGLITASSNPGGKNSLIVMQQLQRQLGKTNPKSHSQGISTPVGLTQHITQQNQAGTAMAVPKNFIISNIVGENMHPNPQLQLHSQRLSDTSSHLNNKGMRETPVMKTNGNNTINRMSEGPQMYGASSDPKKKQNSKSSTKRSSLVSSSINPEASIRNSNLKKTEHQRHARNAESMRSKHSSLHKRKTGGLSSTQKIISESNQQSSHNFSQNTSQMRTSSIKHSKELSNVELKCSLNTATQFMSGELTYDPSPHKIQQNVLNQRSRGQMLQQSVDRPTDFMHHHLSQGNNTQPVQSAGTSGITSPKVIQNLESINQSNSRRSHASSHHGTDHHDSTTVLPNTFNSSSQHQTINKPSCDERSSLQSPAQQQNENGITVLAQGKKFKSSMSGISNGGKEKMVVQVNDVAPTYSSAQQQNNGGGALVLNNNSKRKIITNPQKQQQAVQPRILSKTTKHSSTASKEHLHWPVVNQPQGQALLNQYVSSKKRNMRRNISGERISSIERTSQVAEQIFLQQPQSSLKQPIANPSLASSQKVHQPATNPTKVQGKGQLFQQINIHNKHSKSSFESASQIVTPSVMSAGVTTQGSGSDSLEHLRKASLGGHTQGSSIVPLENPLMIQEQEELEHTPDAMSPRSREIALLTKVISDCFEKYNKMPKTRIELYKVGKILGKGAFGKVNLGLHRLTRKLVAIKSTDKDQIKEESTKRKMMQEIDILKSLKHTSHIKLLETFQTTKHYLIVMELCPGGDLLNYVRKRRKLTERNAKYLFKQIMQGIAYMHQIGIVHRDIKLDNILLDGQGNVKIGDFGVSRRVEQDELLFEQCGTPAYIAPEIVQEIGYKGFPVDIWSAGVCLYAILYGNVPFKANQIQDLTHELYQMEIEYRDSVSELARDLIQSMLEKNVSKRLTAKEVLYHPWFDDTETEVDIFDEQEKNLIRKEFTYILQKSKLREHKNRSPFDLNTEFTEHSIGAASDTGLLKNSSTRSVILCPFNSRQADVAEQDRLPEICAPLMEEKDIMLRFGIRVRELDRAYEKFNNQDFDNGVYHKFAYKQNNQKTEEEKKAAEGDLAEANGPEGGPRSTTRQTILQRILREAQTMPERVMTPESEKYAKIDMNVVERVQKYGFPQSTIINSLRKNLANHCTTSYFLLLMEQNF